MKHLFVFFAISTFVCSIPGMMPLLLALALLAMAVFGVFCAIVGD